MKKILFIFMMVIAMAAIVVNPSDVKVVWDHGGDPNTVVGYNIYYGPSSRDYTNSRITSYTNTTILSNLPPNATIFITGTTIGFDGLETEFGNEISVTIPSITNALPSAVKDFEITKVERTIY